MIHDSHPGSDELFMHRCLELARLGAGHTAPNPMVGAVLVYQEKIIGEGYHQRYGEAHAEVNCINQTVQQGHSDLIPQSTLYVSLEPCSHYGKTPPCTELIIKYGIQKVIIGCRDPNKGVEGNGIEKLQSAGIKTKVGILGNECLDINKRFFTFHTQYRPYIILKWAQTADEKIANIYPDEKITNKNGVQRLIISNENTNRLVHKWRSEESAILIGTHTAFFDNPELTTRFWPGPSPVRLVVDMELQLPADLKLFNESASTIIFNAHRHSIDESFFSSSSPADGKIGYWQVTKDTNLVHQIVSALYQLGIISMMVEGGARLLQSFIDENIWDEARVISNLGLTIGKGLAAPVLGKVEKTGGQKILSDNIDFYKPALPVRKGILPETNH